MKNETSELNIISYNIHSCVGTDGQYSISRICNFLSSSSQSNTTPSILCLQEIESNTKHQQTRLWSASHCHNQPNEVASALQLPFVHFAPAITSVVKSTRVREKHNAEEARYGAFGIAILSKYPIVQVKELKYKRYGTKTLRNAIACLISLPGKETVWIVNTHLGCHWGGEQYQQSLELVSFLQSLEETAASTEGIMLCGDFNSLSLFRSVQTIQSSFEGGIVDTWCEKGIDMGGKNGSICRVKGCTFPVSCPLMRLDYIFWRKNKNGRDGDDGEDGLVLKCVFVLAGGEEKGEQLKYASDHLPLCAIFTIMS